PSTSSLTLSFILCFSPPPRYLHSFPTRRSSDLYCKDAHLFRDFSDDWSSSCTGSAAHACCNEDHVGTLQCIFDLFTGFLSRFFTDIRVCTGTESSSQLFSNLYFGFCF